MSGGVGSVNSSDFTNIFGNKINVTKAWPVKTYFSSPLSELTHSMMKAKDII
jgi:hypothetical protein